MSAPRQFLVPKALCASGIGTQLTLDEMEFYRDRSGPIGEWTRKVLARENGRVLNELLGDDTRLPRGLIASLDETGGAEVVTALVNHKGESWTPFTGWIPLTAAIDRASTIDLDDDDVAFVVRALREGSTGVVMRACKPVAFVSAAGVVDTESGEPAIGASTLPEGAVVVAIVDPIDKDAVLEELAVAPGPVALRRHAGQWYEDSEWLQVLASVKPPTMVKLDEAQVASVASQVDQATADLPFEPFNVDDSDLYRPIVASVYLTGLQNESLERAIQFNMALLAVGGRELSPKDAQNTEKLKRYWTYGPGAAKIRWFTPGAWRRCYRNLVKYLGPKMTPGYCTNLSQRLGGHGVATHVGD